MEPDKTKAAQTLWDFHRERVERGCTGGSRREATRDRHRPNNLLRDVQNPDKFQPVLLPDEFTCLSQLLGRCLSQNLVEQALSQQMEVPQCEQRGGDWSVVRRHLQELIRENSELRKRLTLALQRCLLAGRCTAHQEKQTQTELPLWDRRLLLTRRTFSAQKTKTVSFINGDMRHVSEDGRVVYYYAGAQITHTTHTSGLEILLFPNRQIEKRHPGGRREIVFPDETIVSLIPVRTSVCRVRGSEQPEEERPYRCPRGYRKQLEVTEGQSFTYSTERVRRSGEKVIDFPSGERDVHTPQFKRRQYPDGTVRTIYPDGRQRTQYTSGRVREKNRVTQSE